MRSVQAGSYERLSSIDSLWRAWLACRRGKRRQANVAAFELDADSAILRLHRRLRDGPYRPGDYRLKVVHDPKLRLVAATSIADRVVQTALLDEIRPVYERGFIDQHYACCTGRGPLRAVMAHLASTRSCQFRLSLDIRRYFPSIDHVRLFDLIAHRLADCDTLALLRMLLDKGTAVYDMPLAKAVLGERLSPNCGIPLGGYLSYWSGALYLDGLDHYVKRKLKNRHYQRYMDDMTLFHDDANVLECASNAITLWLRENRGLELKYATLRPTSESSTYLGFRVSRAGVAPGPKAKRRLKQRIREASSHGSADMARSLQAYRGMMLSIG